MSSIQIEIPEEVLISLKQTPDGLSRELCLLAAVKLFELGRLSSGRAAQLAGITRVEFLNILGRYRVSPFTLSAEEFGLEDAYRQANQEVDPAWDVTVADGLSHETW
jgi:predicted HTH domain antitoxin